MNPLSPEQAKKQLEEQPAKVCFVDVRSQDEFLSGHVPGAVCVPLDELERGKTALPKDKLVILSCQMGPRAARAAELLRQRGYENVAEMQGGFSAWRAAGLPVSRLRKSIPIIRQVMLTAGACILAGSVLAITVHPGFLAVPLFFGAGLTFAGASGWCGLAFVLERMPWNRSS